MGIFSSDDDEYTVEETTDWRGQKKIYRDSSGNVVGESREEQGPYGTKEVIRKPSLFGPGEEIAEIGEEQGFLGPKQVIREPRRWGLPGDELGEIGEEQGLLGPKQVMRGPSRWGLPGDKVAEATGERGLVRRLTVLKGRLPWVESREPIGGPEGGAPSPSAPSGSVGSSSRRAGATSASHPVAWTLLAAALLFTVVQVATRDGVTHAPAQPAATGAPGTTPGERFDDSTNSAGQPQSEVEAAVNCPSYTAPEDSRMVGAVSGALAAECGAHDWTFEAMSGEFLTVEASADPSIRALRVRLTAPDGMFLADTDCTVPPAIITDFELYTSGEHHLRVTSCDGEGQYHLRLRR